MSVVGNAHPASGDRTQLSGLRPVRDSVEASRENNGATEMAGVRAENARLRALVVKLSDIVLRNAVERK